MKKLVAAVLAIMMLLSMAALAEAKTPVIAYVPKVEGQAWWEHVRGGVMEWADENGIEVIYKGPTEVDAAARLRVPEGDLQDAAGRRVILPARDRRQIEVQHLLGVRAAYEIRVALIHIRGDLPVEAPEGRPLHDERGLPRAAQVHG